MTLQSLMRIFLLCAYCLFALSACDGVDSDDDDDDGTGGETGEISLWITDAPVPEADRVEITIRGVAIIPQGGSEIEVLLDRPLTVDLLTIVDEDEMREEILDEYKLPEGRYTALRLLLDESRLFVEVDGAQHLMTIPEAEQEGLEVPFNVTVDDDTELDLTLDFDVRKSLRRVSEDQFELHPVLRVVRTERSGFLTGTVAEDLVRDSNCENGTDDRDGNAVYVFAGSGSNYQDLQGNSGDPVATAAVEYELSTRRYEYVLPFLERGSYTAVFTCHSARDDPDEDNSVNMIFSPPVDVEIEAEQIATVDFD